MVADEAGAGVYGALNMLVQRSLIIPVGSYFYYPGLTAYLYLPFIMIWTVFSWINLGSLELVKELVILNNAANLLIFGRIISIVTSLITLYFVYKIARSYLGEKWALLSTVILSFSLIFLVETSFGKPRSISTMFLVIGFYLFLDPPFKTVKSNMLFFGLMIGLSYSAQQEGLIFYVILVAIAFLKHGKRSLYSLPTFLSLILITTLLNPGTLYHNIKLFFDTFQGAELEDPNSLEIDSNFIKTLLFYPKTAFLYFPLEILLIFFAFLMGEFKNKKTQIMWLFCFAYYLIIGPVIGTATTRYLLPVLPFIILLTIKSFKYLFEDYKYRTRVVLISLLLVYSSWNGIFWLVLKTKPSTYELTRDWLIQNVKQDEWILFEKMDLNLPPSKEALQLLMEKSGTFYLKREKLIEEIYSKKYSPEAKYNYVVLFMYESNEQGLISTLKGYLVTTDELEGQNPVKIFYSNASIPDTESIIDNTLSSKSPFLYLPTLSRTGPNINIYRLD